MNSLLRETIIAVIVCLMIIGIPAITADDLYDEDSVDVVINSTSDDVLINNNFMFTCSVNSTNYTHLLLLINGVINGTNMDRINITHVETDEYLTVYYYTFMNAVPSDNGTEFMCNGTDAVMPSDTLLLEVKSPPLFVNATNDTIPLFIKTGVNVNASCKLMYANPPLSSPVNIINDSLYTNNVQFISGESVISFTNATTNNTGNYFCFAINSLGVSFLNYLTFIGGPPDNVSVAITTAVSNDGSSITVSVDISDHSPAPAQMIIIDIPGVDYTRQIIFNDEGVPIPASNYTEDLFTVDSDQVYAGNYIVTVTAINVLGNTSTAPTHVSIQGTRPLEVELVPVSDSVIEGGDYIFNCSIPEDSNITDINITFSVLLDDSTNGEKLKKGVPQFDSQEFIIQNVSYSDDGVMLTCVVNDVYRSNTESMTVLYAPKVLSSVNVSPKTLDDPSFTVSVQFIANPPLLFVDWRRNGMIIHTGENFQIEYNNLTFSNVLPTDNGTYSVTLTNTIGSTTLDFDIIVYYAPKVLSSVNVSHKTLDDPSFTVSVQFIANPPLLFVDWRRNGMIIHTGENFQIECNNLTFSNVLPTDNGTYSVNLTNTIGSTTLDFDIIVYYAPILSFPVQYGGFFDQSLTVNVSVMANPPPSEGNISWYINEAPLVPPKNLKVCGSLLEFTSFLSTDPANYTVVVTNQYGTANETIELIGYNGPYFVEGDSNSSYPLLHEAKTGTNFNLTCTVNYSIPAVEELTIVPSKGPNWFLITNNESSATLVFHNGSAHENSRMFNCTAKTKDTTAMLTYDNYVGGVPDNVQVKVSYNDSKNTVVISMNVTDNSSVPVTHILYNIKGVTKEKSSKSFRHPLKGRTVEFDSIISESYGALGGAGAFHVFEVYAANGIGSVLAVNYNFTIPGSEKGKKSKAGAIAAGIIVPLAVLSLIVVGVIAYIHYRRKKSRGGFTLLADGDDSNINSSGYRTDKVVT